MRDDKSINWTFLPEDGFNTEKYFENLKWENDSRFASNLSGLRIDTGVIEKVTLTGNINTFCMNDVSIRSCNWSNLVCYQPDWVRVKIYDSKLTGLQLTKPNFELIEFNDCQADLMQLRFGKAVKTCFVNCNFSGADFEGSDLTGCRFLNCNLTDAEMSGCKLIKTDFRGSNLQGLHVGVNEIKGAIVSTSQALILTGILGIEILD